MNTKFLKTICNEKAWAFVTPFLGCIAFNALMSNKIRLIFIAAIGIFYLLQLGITSYLDKQNEQKANKLNIVLSTIYIVVGIISYFYIQNTFIYWILYAAFLLAIYCSYIARQKEADWQKTTSVILFSLCALENALINALSINLL